MRKLLTFKIVAFDSHLLRAGTTLRRGDALTFMGVDDAEDDPRVVTKEREDDLTRWLINSPARDLLLRELGAGVSSFAASSVRQPVVENPQDKPGDIDLLICDRGRPDLAVAIQCKRVKVTASDQDDDEINKLPDVSGGVRQANLQRDNFGFHRNYLAVLIEVDGRRRVKNNALFRGTTGETLQSIYQFPQRESLHEDVGVIFIQVAQPTGKSFADKAVVGVCVDWEAARLEQPVRLTNRLRGYVESAMSPGTGA